MPEPKPIQDCKTVAELLADEKRWTQKAGARTKDGDQTYAGSSEATCFCLYGAMIRVYGDFTAEFFDALTKLRLGQSVGNFNDTHTHAEVLEKCREAGI